MVLRAAALRSLPVPLCHSSLPSLYPIRTNAVYATTTDACQLRRIPLPRTPLNKGKKEGRSPSEARTPAWWFSFSGVLAPATSSRFSGGENHLHRVRVCGVGEHIVGVHDLIQLEVVGAKDRRIQTPLRNKLEKGRGGGRVDQPGGDGDALDPERLQVKSCRTTMYPDVRNMPAGTHELGAQLEGLWHPDRLHHHVGPEPVGHLLDLLGRVFGGVVDGGVGPE